MTATRREIKRAYRQLAIRFHPDRQPGNEDARRRFVELSEAYHRLMNLVRAREHDREFGVCGGCGRVAEVVRGLDGRTLCRQCLLQPRASRFLPLPQVVIVKCAVSSALLIGAGICLIEGWWSGSRATLALATSAGCLSLLTLAATCLRVRHCAGRQERRKSNR